MQAFIPAAPLSRARAAALPARRSPPLPARGYRARRTRARVTAALRGSQSNPYRIAVLPGDGFGPSTAAAAVKVLDELTSAADMHFTYTYAAYGAPAFEESGVLVPEETLAVCRASDAVLRSYQGMERGVAKDGSAHLQLRDRLGLFAQFRPVVVYPQLAAASSLREEIVRDIDIMLVREVSAGALGADSIAADGDQARSEIAYTADQVCAIADAALQVAERRSGRMVNVDKADAMSVSRFWRANLHRQIEKRAKGNDGIVLTDMFIDDFVREVILRPAEFDVVVTSNLFGDIVAEVLAALAGPQRTSPSFWVNRDGLGVYGPADIYNPTAYPAGAAGAAPAQPSPIAMIRAASMMLRYALEEPAAGELIQQALGKAMAEVATPGTPATSSGGGGGGGGNGNGNGSGNGSALPTVSAEEYADVVVRAMQMVRQYEQVCDPTECGE